MPGWNLGNQLESNSDGTPSETAWGNPVITENLIKQVKAQGFKSIRIPVSYLSKMIRPDYTIDSKWLDRVQEVVDMCIDNGLYAIINVHGDALQHKRRLASLRRTRFRAGDYKSKVRKGLGADSKSLQEL